MSKLNPEAPVKRQLDAYNAKDIETFCTQFSDNVRVYRPPQGEPTIEGMADFRTLYAKRFESPGLNAKILNRTIVGNKVIDHEKVWGIEDEPIEVAVVYEVIDEQIHNVWFF